MCFVRFFTFIASCLSVAHAFSVTVGTPTQCDSLMISWTGGQAPFEILLTPSDEPYQNIPVPASAFSNGKGSYSIPQLLLLSGTSFLLTMSDATGFGSGGTTNELTVGNSVANNICSSPLSSPPYTFDLSPNSLTQCSQFTVTANSGAVPPITIGQLIPGGQSVVFNSGSNTFKSVLDVIAGTNVMYFVNDSLGNQGGVSPFEPVSGSSDSSCLSANSPSSTTPGMAATATASPSSSSSSSSSSLSSHSSSHSSSSNVALIAGVAGGGAAVLITLVILGMCWRHKRKTPRCLDVKYSTKSRPHRLQRTDTNYEDNSYSDIPPPSPFPYTTDLLSNHTRPIKHSLMIQPDMTISSASNFAAGIPPPPFNQTQYSRQSSNTDIPVYGDARSSTISSANNRQSPLSTGSFAVDDPRTPSYQTMYSLQSSNADFVVYGEARSSAMASVDRRMSTITEMSSQWEETRPISYLDPSIQSGSQPSPINASAANLTTRDHHAPFNQAQPLHLSSNTDSAVDGDTQMSYTMPIEHGARPASPLPQKTDSVYLSPPVQPSSQSISTSAGNVAPPTHFNQTQRSHQSPDTDSSNMHGASGSPLASASRQTAYQPPTRIIVHTDAADANGVVELPPQYSEHWGMRSS